MTNKNLSYYEQQIIKATNCTQSQVAHVENFMRDYSPTLDHLSKTEFNNLAVSAYVLYKTYSA